MNRTMLAGLALLCPLATLAADEIRPFDAKLGLWETTATTEVSGMPAMPQISEETLKKDAAGAAGAHRSDDERARSGGRPKDDDDAVLPDAGVVEPGAGIQPDRQFLLA